MLLSLCCLGAFCELSNAMFCVCQHDVGCFQMAENRDLYVDEWSVCIVCTCACTKHDSTSTGGEFAIVGLRWWCCGGDVVQCLHAFRAEQCPSCKVCSSRVVWHVWLETSLSCLPDKPTWSSSVCVIVEQRWGPGRLCCHPAVHQPCLLGYL